MFRWQGKGWGLDGVIIPLISFIWRIKEKGIIKIIRVQMNNHVKNHTLFTDK